MNLTEVKKSLEKMFARDLTPGSRRNIVFWYDETASFAQDIDTLALDNAKTIKLFDNNAFATKLYIEREDPDSNLLVYSPLPRPSNKENWLTDTVKYSQTFSTDEASLILLNYRLDSSLRPLAEEYKAFFRNNERCRRFEGYGIVSFTETKLDVAILSVLCKLPVPNFDACIREILSGLVSGDASLVDSISKFGSMDRLWLLISRTYGYGFEDRDFEKLAILLLVTHLSHGMKSLPKAWEGYVSEDTNGLVLVDNFMKNSEFTAQYNAISDMVAERLHLSEQMPRWNMDEIIECDTFRHFDEAILKRLGSLMIEGIREYEQYRKTINARRNKRWFDDFEMPYMTLLHACEFLSLNARHPDYSAPSAESLWKSYASELFRIDSEYRHFVLCFDRLGDPDEYRALSDMVENVYVNAYLAELSVAWCNALDNANGNDGTLDWGIAGVLGQERFFETKLKPFVIDDGRIVIIISDGLRYEAGVELGEAIRREHKGECDLSPMLGAIPSYTRLGMAALLPHGSIGITDGGDVTVDGLPTKSTENREKILVGHKRESIAITYEKLSEMSKAQMNEALGGMKVIYVYHNTIDRRGEHAEREVFDATEKAIRELTGLVRTLKNNIGAINFFITADHGYIYRRTPMSESDKTPSQAEGSIESKRRFILTKADTRIQGTQAFSLRNLGIPEIKAILPRGANGFKMLGSGANYVHGGAALQEVMIPLIKYHSAKNTPKATAARKVGLGLTSITRKVTSLITHLNFYQSEPIEDKKLPLRINVCFEDENGERISSENIIIADSASPNPEDRVFKEKFTLRNIAYDKSRQYYLVIRDDDETVDRELDRIPFTIDLAFGSGIQF